MTLRSRLDSMKSLVEGCRRLIGLRSSRREAPQARQGAPLGSAVPESVSLRESHESPGQQAGTPLRGESRARRVIVQSADADKAAVVGMGLNPYIAIASGHVDMLLHVHGLTQLDIGARVKGEA